MKQLKDIVLERLILSKNKKYLTEEALLQTKKGNNLGKFSIKNEDGDTVYLEYYSLVLNSKAVAFLEDWSDTVFGERWQIIIIPDALFDSLNLEEDVKNSGFIVPKNIKNHIIDIFEFDEEENIDIMSVSIWYSLRNDETYCGSNNQLYASFVEKIHDNL